MDYHIQSIVSAVKQVPAAVLIQMAIVGASLLGAVARVLNEYNNTGVWAWGKSIAGTSVAGFSGWVLANFFLYTGVDYQLAIILGSAGAFNGAEGLKWLYEKFVRKQ